MGSNPASPKQRAAASALSAHTRIREPTFLSPGRRIAAGMSARLDLDRQRTLAALGDAGAQRFVRDEVGKAAAAHRLHVDEDVLAVLGALADDEAVALQAVELFAPHRLELPRLVDEGGRVDAF